MTVVYRVHTIVYRPVKVKYTHLWSHKSQQWVYVLTKNHSFRFQCNTSSSIHIQSFNGTVNRPLFRASRQLSVLAYDWIGRNLYWSAADQLNVTSAARPDQQRTLLQQVAGTVSIALDPKAGMMYVGLKATFERKGQIAAVWMDGSTRSVLVESTRSDELYMPSSMQVDTVNRRLYWCDSLRFRIGRIRLDGSQREHVQLQSFREPLALALLGSSLFWSERNAIYRLDQNETEAVKVLNARNRALKVLDINSQLARPTESLVRCVGLVLVTPLGLHCQCGDGYTLNASGTKCMPQTKPTAAAAASPKTCGISEFLCVRSQQCIDAVYTCDGEDDCDDGSDEASAMAGPCSALSCSTSKMFRCVDGKRCVRLGLVCDGVPHCADGSDEAVDRCKRTPVTRCNNATQFECKSLDCIAQSWKCDGQRDCRDGSDEWEDVCGTACPEFRCLNGKCLFFSQQCDGLNDCG